MLWLIDYYLNKESAYDKLIAALVQLGEEYKIVKAVHFTNILIDPSTDTSKALTDVDNLPQIEIDGSRSIITFGTYTLSKTAKAKGWTPGAYISPAL